MGDPAVRHKELETTTHNDKDKGPGERKGCSGLQAFLSYPWPLAFYGSCASEPVCKARTFKKASNSRHQSLKDFRVSDGRQP